MIGKPLKAPKKSDWRPSAKIESNTYSPQRQQLLDSLGSQLLRKDKFFVRKHRAFSPVEAEQIGSNSRLRPTWQGRP